MDAATLYMVITLADGSREASVMQFPFATAAECNKAAKDVLQGRTADLYRSQGKLVEVRCGFPRRPLVIAR